jgi:hypothetical protein
VEDRAYKICFGVGEIDLFRGYINLLLDSTYYYIESLHEDHQLLLF